MDKDATTTEENTSEEEEQTTSEENTSEDKSSSVSEELTDKQKEEQIKEEARRKSHEGLVKQQLTNLATEDGYTIDDVPEKYRDDVIDLQNKLRNKVTVKTEPKVDENELEDRLMAKFEFKKTIEGLLDEEKAEATATYDSLKEKGHSADEALELTKLKHNIMNKDELARREKQYAARFHKAGSAPKDKNKKVEISQREAEIARKCGNDPEKVYT